MKRLWFLTLLLCALSASAQEKRFPSVAMSDEQLIFGIFLDNWLGLPEYVDGRLINQGYSIQLLYDQPLGLSNFSLAFGLGWRQHNLFSDAYPVKDLLLSEGRTQFYLVPGYVGTESIEYSLNKMALNYVELPVEFRYRSRSDLKFKLTLGGTAALLASSYIKYKGDDFWSNPVDVVKIKRFGIPNAALFVYAANLRIGVRQWGFNVNYQFPSVFKKDMGPDLVPVSFGLTFNPM